MFDSIVQLFTGKVSLNEMVGPVGISQMVSQTSGVLQFVYLLAIISISLGVTNLLPFVPLDGGKALLIIIEAIRKKPLKRRNRNEATIIRIFSINSIICNYRME